MPPCLGVEDGCKGIAKFDHKKKIVDQTAPKNAQPRWSLYANSIANTEHAGSPIGCNHRRLDVAKGAPRLLLDFDLESLPDHCPASPRLEGTKRGGSFQLEDTFVTCLIKLARNRHSGKGLVEGCNGSR